MLCLCFWHRIKKWNVYSFAFSGIEFQNGSFTLSLYGNCCTASVYSNRKKTRILCTVQIRQDSTYTKMKPDTRANKFLLVQYNVIRCYFIRKRENSATRNGKHNPTKKRCCFKLKLCSIFEFSKCIYSFVYCSH